MVIFLFCPSSNYFYTKVIKAIKSGTLFENFEYFHFYFNCSIFNFSKIKQKLDDILERLPDPFPVKELVSKIEEKTPFIIVAIQECERMNYLTIEIRRSLKELNLGLKVTTFWILKNRWENLLYSHILWFW